MQVSVWHDGKNSYGFRVGNSNRDEFFNTEWSEIEVELDGQFFRFHLTPGFWKKCPEFRDSDGHAIREWLTRHDAIE